MSWFELSLGSAVSAALSDLFAKKALPTVPVPIVAWARFAFALPVLAAAVAVWGWVPPAGRFWWALAAALPLEVGAALLYQRALKLSPLGLTAPYLAFTPAFLALTGRWILGEVPSPLAYAGIGLVTAGGYAVQLAPGMGPLGPLRALLRERGSLLMLGVALIFSVTAALGKVAVTESSPQTFALVYYGCLTAALGPWALAAARRRPGTRLGAVAPVGLFGAAMILLHFSAIRLAPASYMIAVKRSSLLWSILLGRFVLGEANLAGRLLGGGLMLCGVALLAAAS